MTRAHGNTHTRTWVKLTALPSEYRGHSGESITVVLIFHKLSNQALNVYALILCLTIERN